eukprot:g6310.t1
MDSAAAKLRWELENNVQSEQDSDSLFAYNAIEERNIRQRRPWTTDPNYFKHVQISALALLKMAMHAKSGGTLEVMGLMQGKIQEETFVVLDSFALPVEGTETRVNAMESANVFMCEFINLNSELGQQENVIGWYHSHPGYGCWLSGIDVSTQMTNQQGQDPFLAVVIDPVRTMSSGKVEIGAFRTYPEGYKTDEDEPSEYQTIPLEKIADFGVHARQYYSLDITYFKSSLNAKLLDLLWSNYWVNTLSASPLNSNREFVNQQVLDLANKMHAAKQQLLQKGGGRLQSSDDKRDSNVMLKLTKDTCKLALEQIKGLSCQIIKQELFNAGSTKASLNVETKEEERFLLPMTDTTTTTLRNVGDDPMEVNTDD